MMLHPVLKILRFHIIPAEYDFQEGIGMEEVS